MDDNLHLKFTEFEIHMFYGFLIQSPIKDEAKDQFNEIKHSGCKKKKNCQMNGTTHMRGGWCATYQINSGQSETIQFKHQISDHSLILEGVRIEESKGSHDRWPSARKPLMADISTYFSLRKDGAGTLTLSFKFKADKEKIHYSVADVLLASNLVPRSLHNNGECSRVTNLDLAVPDILTGNGQKCWEKLSFPFQLFVLVMRDFVSKYGLVWEEIQFKDIAADAKGKNIADYLYGELSCGNDPQVPYQYVFAGMENAIYRQAFLDDGMCVDSKRNERKKYSKEIAAILGRWFNENNIKYTSADYWEQRGLMKDACFYSQYMNSLIFTTFSGLLTLSFYPSTDKMTKKDRKYFEPVRNNTFDTIMRCLEFSRLRWHSAIWLNMKVDNFIGKIKSTPQTESFTPLLKDLIAIEEMVALHLENPFSHLWDASVGTHISTFLHKNLLEGIESEIGAKVNHARNMLQDRLRVVETFNAVQSIYDKYKKK